MTVDFQSQTNEYCECCKGFIAKSKNVSQCSLLIPLKTSQNIWFSDGFSDVSKEIKKEHLEEKD